MEGWAQISQDQEQKIRCVEMLPRVDLRVGHDGLKQTLQENGKEKGGQLYLSELLISLYVLEIPHALH